MQAIKQYTEVINGSIHVNLPESFTAKRVELIILGACRIGLSIPLIA